MAVKDKVFDWYEVTAFLQTNVLPYLIVWSGLALVPVAMKYAELPVEVTAPLGGLAALAYATIVGHLVKSIYDNIRALGIPLE